MKIINHSYKRRGTIEFMFDDYPFSKVIFSPIKNYYFVRTVRWDPADSVVTRNDLEKMEILANEFLGCLDFYKDRKAYKEYSR
ncbi:hypothetical protein FS935_10855 [Metabacillus litoralis]|uniref:Uncharacterized protein n=1 Tax=Metabacillus litoralis TaxID=152268 RepID=A0A5C6VYK8_9BACI|nr:hypothetical protein [Metabacillus litoralis]TXC90435.1 hypothetical protein FS935_10855 [Metabacillus litoralis]